MKQFEVGKTYRCSGDNAGNITVTHRTRKYIFYVGSCGVTRSSMIHNSTLNGTEYIFIDCGIWTYIYTAEKEVQ